MHVCLHKLFFYFPYLFVFLHVLVLLFCLANLNSIKILLKSRLPSLRPGLVKINSKRKASSYFSFDILWVFFLLTCPSTIFCAFGRVWHQTNPNRTKNKPKVHILLWFRFTLQVSACYLASFYLYFLFLYLNYITFLLLSHTFLCAIVYLYNVLQYPETHFKWKRYYNYYIM